MDQLLGVSQRTLEALFKTEIGMTPKQFATVLRLNAVRRELLGTPAEKVYPWKPIVTIAILKLFFSIPV